MGIGRTANMRNASNFPILTMLPPSSLIASLKTTGTFYVFMGVSILGMISTWFLTIETKGRDADEIDRQEMAEKAARG